MIRRTVASKQRRNFNRFADCRGIAFVVSKSHLELPHRRGDSFLTRRRRHRYRTPKEIYGTLRNKRQLDASNPPAQLTFSCTGLARGVTRALLFVPPAMS